MGVDPEEDRRVLFERPGAGIQEWSVVFDQPTPISTVNRVDEAHALLPDSK